MLNDVIYISLSFMSFSNMNLEDARILEVELIERFLRIVNNHKKIRPYLREYPFPALSVDIMLSFEPFEYKDKCVNHVFQARGKLFYYFHGNVGRDCVPDLEEPYEEAYNIVKATRPEIAQIFREQK
jgi:hypothetical protein